MKKIVKRLRLRRGDIIVVNTVETCRRLMRSGARPPDGVTNIPIVVAPEGVRQIPLKQLKALVAELEKENVNEN